MKTQNEKVGHTPGPWETSVTSDGKEWAICEAGGGDVIAEICSENPESDARLIAAAPELLEALKFLTDEYAKSMKDAGVTNYPEALAIVRNARAAIAKAQ